MYKYFDLVKVVEESHVLTVWRSVTGEGGDYGRLSTPIPISEMQIRQNVCMKIKKIYCRRAHAFKMKTWIQDKATNFKLKK